MFKDKFHKIVRGLTFF